MPDPLPAPELQFIDANGNPYSGGTLELYESGTTTPKNSWLDAGGTTLNTNPIVLDSAGRCIVWGDGLYRCILKDADGNLIFDQLSTTVISAAMVPVVSAPTLAAARAAMGVTDAIQVETDRALAAEAAIVSGGGGYATSSALTAEVTRAQAAENALQNAITAERNRALAAEAALAASGSATVKSGLNTTDGSGNATVTFGSPFSSHCDAVVATADSVSWWCNITAKSTTGFSVRTSSPLAGGSWSGGPVDFHWIAAGT